MRQLDAEMSVEREGTRRTGGLEQHHINTGVPKLTLKT